MEKRCKNIMSSTNYGFEKIPFKIESLKNTTNSFIFTFVVYNLDISSRTKIPTDGMFK